VAEQVRGQAAASASAVASQTRRLDVVDTETRETNPPRARVAIWPHNNDVLPRNAGCGVTCVAHTPHTPHPSHRILHLLQGDGRTGGRRAGRQATEQWAHLIPLTSPTAARRDSRWAFMLRLVEASIALNERDPMSWLHFQAPLVATSVFSSTGATRPLTVSALRGCVRVGLRSRRAAFASGCVRVGLRSRRAAFASGYGRVGAMGSSASSSLTQSSSSARSVCQAA
jgi:hypothetical protein